MDAVAIMAHEIAFFRFISMIAGAIFANSVTAFVLVMQLIRPISISPIRVIVAKVLINV